MAQTKTSKKKNAAQKPVEKRTSEKNAKKALAKAKKAVETARKAVRTSTKKRRTEAAALAKATRKLDAKQAAAPRSTMTSPEKAAKRAVSAHPVNKPAATGVTPTVAELRARAKAQKIAGYSRLNKAALIDALDSTPSP